MRTAFLASVFLAFVAWCKANEETTAAATNTTQSVIRSLGDPDDQPETRIETKIAISVEDPDDKSPSEEKQYFTDEWRALYSEKQLKTQPKWYLTENQPADAPYQTRLYPEQWWVKYFQNCKSADLTSSQGYTALYFFFNGFNYQRQSYSLTYPILLEVDSRPLPTPTPTTPTTTPAPTKKPKGKKRRWRNKKGKKWSQKRRWQNKKLAGNKNKPTSKPKVTTTTPKPTPKVCPVRYSTMFFLPIPLDKWAPTTQDKAITSFKMLEETYFVRGYAGNFTNAYCNEQATILAAELTKNNETAWDDYWVCARYEPPAGQTEQKYEVWMLKR